jgi:hypothetical protein
MVDKRESEQHQTCGNKHMFPLLDAFDEVPSRFCFLFVKGNQNRIQPPLPVVCRIEFHMGFSPLLTQHETTMWLCDQDQVGSQELEGKVRKFERV